MMPSNYSTESTSSPDHHHQLNLFPLRPSSSIVDAADVDNNVEYLFNSAADDGSATTLTSIFGSTTTTTSSTSSSSMTEDQHTFNDGRLLLERTALRKKELRDRTAFNNNNEEDQRWVCYSEVMSGGVGTSNHDDHEMKMMKMAKRRRRRLELKLDYQQIINTWGRSFIHIQMESPAMVPDLHNPNHHQSMFMISPRDQTGGETSMGGWGYNNDIGGLWSVPETKKRWCNNNNARENVKIKEELGVESGQHLREASMLRYKEKRQSRLFSKRIRYQVRKINAEKRPRLKGRFVKRS